MLLAFFFSLGAQGFAGLESGHPEQALDLAPIKAHHRLPINNGDRGRPVAELQEILERSRVCANVLVHEGHTLARKKLFLLLATPSPGLGIHDDLLRHDLLHIRLESRQVSVQRTASLRALGLTPTLRWAALDGTPVLRL